LFFRKDEVQRTFDIIPDHEDVFEEGVPQRDSFSAFNVGENPAGVLQEGYNDFTWNDVTGDVEVGPGDSFVWYFDDCWDDDPDDDIDDLYNGTINLMNYVDNEEDGVTIRIGYEPPVEGPGGVYFENFEISEIEEDGGIYSHDSASAVTLNGGYIIVFYEPED
jgi:hypothetical protein